MKKISMSFTSNRLMRRLTTFLAAVLTVGTLTLVAGNLLTSARADSSHDLDELNGILENAQVAELLQLAADFHGAASYNGNITAMMSLWADNSSLTLNGTAHVGKDAIQAFFLSIGYFNNNWVSLAPEYKTQITVHGNTATITTQCVAVDLTVSPMVVRGVIQVNATCEKIRGKWLFTSMNNTTPAPL
ncbi:MAG: hypothetical protein ACREIC_21325 [Limisphaerales bacterium]